MFRIATQEPEWLTLFPAQGKQPAAEMLFAPITRKMRRKAARAGRAALPGDALALAGPIGELSDEQYDALADVGDLSAAELIRLGARDWRGVSADGKKALPFSAEALELALADEAFFAAAERAYVVPDAIRQAEKNGLSGSLNGTGAKATPEKIIAASPAPPKKTGAARNAPTGSKSSTATKPKASGRS